MITERPFVDFYSAHGLTPTRQDVSDLKRHFQRREALHRQLGIPTGLLKNASLVEFGPGSGHNAIFWASCKPARYVLVDATPASLDGTRTQLDKYFPEAKYEIVASDILHFQTEERFDLVVCEGVIPTQKNPGAFLQHIASFASPGGLVVMTCMDAISVLPEILRRYAAAQVTEGIMEFDEKIKMLVGFFKPDLSSLAGMSRRHEDWVIDQILHPWSGPLLSMPEAIAALEADYEVHGSSPRFVNDWRWYKDLHGAGFAFNQSGVESYFGNAHNFVDYRYATGSRDAGENAKLVEVCDAIYSKQFASERGIEPYLPAALIQDLERVIECLEGGHSETLAALKDFVNCTANGRFNELSKFRKLWGRGQQYLSFIRNAETALVHAASEVESALNPPREQA